MTQNCANVSGMSNGTRGVFGGGIAPSNVTNVINYVTIASAADAADFGDLTAGRHQFCAQSDSH